MSGATTLERDLQELLLGELLRHTPYPKELAALGTRDLLGVYANWAHRFPPVRPRNVHVSSELRRLVRGRGVLAHDVRTVLAELRDGADVEYRLSQDVDVAWVPPHRGRRERLRQRDRYLAAWGIHHLHLGPPHPDTQRARSDDLLYAVFLNRDVFALAVLPHGAWKSDRLLHIAADNWPDGGPLLAARSDIRLAREHNELDRAALFKANVAVPFTRNERVYTARDHISLAGTSLAAEQWANQTYFDLQRTIQRLQRDPAAVTAALQRKGHPEEHAGSPAWTIQVLAGELVLQEVHTGAYLRLSDAAQLPPVPR